MQNTRLFSLRVIQEGKIVVTGTFSTRVIVFGQFYLGNINSCLWDALVLAYTYITKALFTTERTFIKEKIVEDVDLLLLFLKPCSQPPVRAPTGSLREKFTSFRSFSYG